MHNVERWQKIESLYQAALELDEAERAAFLDRECADDLALRQEVASLLASHEAAGSFLVAPAIQVAARAIASEQDDVIAGGVVGPYQIIRLLGRGGMGEVYLAQDTRLGRRVAVKLLPTYFTREAGRLRRFQLEARAASALNHPNVITIFEIGEADAIHFIATEYVEGETLRQRIKRGPVAASEALAMAVQIASALEVAHEAGIVHRDIKPENLMLRPDGLIKVVDFGLAKQAERQERMSANESALWNSTDPGVVMGTASYMSPEQARGLRVDRRTDLFSLGVVLYEMVSGRTPFQGETPSDVIAAILTQEPPPLAADLSPAPELLRRVISKALVKEREARYQTASEMLIDLKKLKAQMDLSLQSSAVPRSLDMPLATPLQSAIVTGERGSKPATEAAFAPPAPDAVAIRTDDKTRKRVIFSIALGIVAVIALAAYWLIHRGRPSDQSAPFAAFKVSKLTTTGRAKFAAISPDGKYAVHVMGSAGQPSLWLRHIPTGSDKEILPAVHGTLSGLTFSKDGNYVYYDQFIKDETILYRVPVLGGVVQKLVADIDTTISFSPDGEQMAYVRGLPQEDHAALMIANADGSGEQRLASFNIRYAFPSSPSLLQTWGPSWSPDGETIMMGVRDSNPMFYNWNLIAVHVKDGTTRQLTSQRWSSVGQMAWLADGKGLIVAAAEHPIYSPHQLWHVSFPDGLVKRITNDLNNYIGVSLTANGDSLITVQSEQLSNVWIASDSDWSRALQATSNNHDGVFGVAWTPDGRILYTSIATGSRDIWAVNADGTGQKQVTPDPGLEGRPVVTPDSRYIVFVSARTGTSHIWRCDMDSGNLKQLTNGISESNPNCSPDSHWVYYSAAISNTKRLLWKVSIDGGEPVQLSDFSCVVPKLSPDGKQFAVNFIDETVTPKRYRVGLLSIDGGLPTKAFDIPYSPGQLIRWTADGRGLTYLDTRAGVTNIWAQPVDGSAARQVTDFKSDLIFFYDWSRDGKKLAYARGLVTDDVVLIVNSK